MKTIKIKKGYLFIIFIVTIIIFILIWVIAGTRGVRVSSTEVIKGELKDNYSEKGVYKVGTEYQVVSKISGSVESVVVDENSEVKKGDVLVLISERDLNYELELHKSNLLGYQSQLDQNNINQIMSTSPQEYLDKVSQELTSSAAQYQAAKSVADGSNTLYQAGSISKVEWEKTQAEYREADKNYQAAKNRFEESQKFLDNLIQQGVDKKTLNSRFYESISGQMEALVQTEKTTISKIEDQIKDCRVVAECDGTIISLPAKEQSVVQEGQVIAIIDSIQEPVVEADVLTTIEPYLMVGSQVIVTQNIRNQEYKYNGSISEIYNFAVQGKSALGLDEYRVRVNVKINPDQEILLKSGYSFDLQFTLYEGKDVLIIPINAVFQVDGQDYVFVIDNGYVTKKSVKIGYRSSSQVIIEEGLEEGERIITKVDSEDIYEGLKGYY